MLRTLRDEGKTIILITHKLREIMAITDEVSVMRQGAMVKTLTDHGDLARRTRRTDGRPPRAAARRKEAPPIRARCCSRSRISSVTDDFKSPRVKDVSFTVRAGEIVGIAGVAGNGQSELLESISGMRDQQSGIVQAQRHAALARGR